MTLLCSALYSALNLVIQHLCLSSRRSLKQVHPAQALKTGRLSSARFGLTVFWCVKLRFQGCVQEMLIRWGLNGDGDGSSMLQGQWVNSGEGGFPLPLSPS